MSTCLVLPYRAWLNVFEEVRSGRRGVLTLRYPKWNCPLVSEVTQLSDFLPDPKFSFEPSSTSLPLFHISGMKIPWLLVRVCSPTPFCPHFVLYCCRTHMCHLALTYVSLWNIQHSAGPSEQGSVRTFFKLHKKGIFSYEHLDFVKGVQLKEVDFFLYVAQYTLPARSNVYHSLLFLWRCLISDVPFS